MEKNRLLSLLSDVKNGHVSEFSAAETILRSQKDRLIDFLTWIEENPNKEEIEKIVNHYFESI
jgi:predicted CopG family antitoxin